ncbi:hypothetical protein [Gracilimonas tropica]|uniref:hypothetical protein n=1 Tax=Gracilimonas tropica TaxID=454600 RepID=UPI0003725E30|nr:hypothetical protein [Gracilimonas tropica]
MYEVKIEDNYVILSGENGVHKITKDNISGVFINLIEEESGYFLIFFLFIGVLIFWSIILNLFFPPTFYEKISGEYSNTIFVIILAFISMFLIDKVSPEKNKHYFISIKTINGDSFDVESFPEFNKEVADKYYNKLCEKLL